MLTKTNPLELAILGEHGDDGETVLNELTGEGHNAALHVLKIFVENKMNGSLLLANEDRSCVVMIRRINGEILLGTAQAPALGED